MLGMADLGIASRNDMVQNADMIANLDPHKHELIADMDTGYGGELFLSRRFSASANQRPYMTDLTTLRPCHNHPNGQSIHPRQRRWISHRRSSPN